MLQSGFSYLFHNRYSRGKHWSVGGYIGPRSTDQQKVLPAGLTPTRGDSFQALRAGGTHGCQLLGLEQAHAGLDGTS